MKSYLKEIKEDLRKVEEQHAKISRRAHRNAGISLGLGFLGCLSQLTGMGYCIYFVWDWNEMEPWTWMFQSFYMMVGSFYFMRYKSDWAYTSVYDMLYQRNLHRTANKQDFDLKMTAALKEYVEDLESKLSVLDQKYTKEEAGK